MAAERRYKVAHVRVVLDRVEKLGRMAATLGHWVWFVDAMRAIEDRLQSDPESWGDPQFDYPSARLRNYQAYHEQFVVNYAIHLDQPVVFVRSIEFMSGSPLFGQEG